MSQATVTGIVLLFATLVRISAWIVPTDRTCPNSFATDYHLQWLWGEQLVVTGLPPHFCKTSGLQNEVGQNDHTYYHDHDQGNTWYIKLRGPKHHGYKVCDLYWWYGDCHQGNCHGTVIKGCHVDIDHVAWCSTTKWFYTGVTTKSYWTTCKPTDKHGPVEDDWWNYVHEPSSWQPPSHLREGLC